MYTHPTNTESTHFTLCKINDNFILAVCISFTAPSRISTVSLTKTMLERHKPSLTVTWTVPQSDVGISNYQVEYRKSEDTEWIPGPILSRSMTFTNLPALTAGTVYSIRVRAVSAVGDGNWSNVQTERTYKCELITIYTLLLSENIK